MANTGTVGKPVVVYGASGYTGRLICEYLRELNVGFIAAGRNKKRLAEALSRVPGIETVAHDAVEVEHETGALTELFSGTSVVCNAVGPFSRLGDPVVEAALTAGCHYLDVTGEQNWLIHAQQRWGAAFADAGLLMAPGVAHMYTTSEIAANICLEYPGMDTLDILVQYDAASTFASTQTIFAILSADWYHLVENEYVRWPPASRFEVTVPGRNETSLALPWGGMCHTVWFKDDPRVANCRAVGGVANRAVMEAVAATTVKVETEIRNLPADRQGPALTEIADQWQAGTPPRQNPRLNTSLDSVYASGPLGRAHCVIHGNSNYKQTGLLQAWAARYLTQRQPRRVGQASGCQAFGHRELLGTLRAFGLVLPPVVTVHQ